MPESTEEKSKPELIVYIGRRTTVKNRLGYFWKFPDGERGFRKNLAPAAIGETWEIVLSNDLIQSIKRTDIKCSDNDHRKWSAESVAHEQFMREMKANRALAKRESEFDRLLAPLIRMRATFENLSMRSAFDRAVLESLQLGPRRARR